LVNTCGYELPTNLQNFMQKDLTEVEIFQKVLGGLLFSETPCTYNKQCAARRSRPGFCINTRALQVLLPGKYRLDIITGWPKKLAPAWFLKKLY